MSAQQPTIKSKRSTSLAATLATTFVVLVVLSLLLVSSIQMFLNFRAQQAVKANEQRNITLGVAQQVSNFVGQIFTAMEAAVSLTNPFSGSAEEQKLLLEKLLGLEPALREVILLDKSGQEIAKLSRLSITAAADLTNQANTDLFKQTSQAQRYISPVHIDETTYEPLVTIAIPIKNVFGDFEGALAAEFNLKFMWDLVGSLQVGETGVAYVVDRQGNLLAFGDTSRVLLGENLSHLAEVAEFVERANAEDELEETSQQPIVTGINGDNVLAAYSPLGTPDWAVVVELPVAEAYRPIISNLVLSAGILLGVAILAGIAGIYMARRLAAPLGHLTETATRIAGGETELTAPLEGPTELTLLAGAFNSMTAQLRELIDSLEQRVIDRTHRLEIAATLGERVSATLKVDEVMAEAVNQIKDSFGYYHAHIYLLDDKQEKLVVAEGTGTAGAEMKAMGHNIPLDAPTSLVARAARTGQIVRVDNVREAADWLPNPLLPDTYSEIAVPIVLEGQVVGVLDVQEDEIGRLDEGDANLLRSLANQVAVSIRNARQFTQVEKALAEAHAAQQRYLEQAWQKTKLIAKGSQYLYKESDTVGVDEVQRQMFTRAHQEALAIDHPTVVTLEGSDSERNALIAPIRLRGKFIGDIQLHASNSNAWGEDELVVIETILAQLAQSAENLRLFDETRQRAGRERTIREITERMRTATSLEELVKTTAQELGERLAAGHAIVELGIEAGSVVADSHNWQDGNEQKH